MWHLIPLLLAAPAVQDPAPVSQPVPPPAPAAQSPAQQAWTAWQKRLAAAQGLSLGARMTLEDSSIPQEELMPVAMEIQLALARPSAGKATWTTVFGEGEDAETVVLEWIGNGEKIYAVDHEEKSLSVEGAAWNESELGFFLPFLGPTWSSASLTAHDVALLPALAEHPDWQGLRIRDAAAEADSGEELAEVRIWLGPDGLLRRAVSSLGGTAVLNFEVSRMELAEKVNLKQFIASFPEGYEVFDEESGAGEDEAGGSSLEASLLPVGAPAPEALFIGMDDAEFSLSSLRGKTVLLNFWFFH